MTGRRYRRSPTGGGWKRRPSYRRRHAENVLDAGEVVVHEMQRDRCDVLLQLLAEAIRQPSERRLCIRIVRFCRSTWLGDVLAIGLPMSIPPLPRHRPVRRQSGR